MFEVNLQVGYLPYCASMSRGRHLFDISFLLDWLRLIAASVQ